jgi:hypothetical protein
MNLLCSGLKGLLGEKDFALNVDDRLFAEGNGEAQRLLG